MSDITARPVLHRRAFAVADVTFLDAEGNSYVPGIVEKKVITASGFTITDWTEVADFESGQTIEVTADETEMQNLALLTDKHIVLIVGDRGTATENPLRIIVPIVNRERLP